MAAAGLADVGAGNAQPLEVLRALQHPLEQLTVAGLQFLALAQGSGPGRDSRGERVPDLLQRAEVQRARRDRRGRDRGVEPEARKGLGDQRRELALEPADLAAQLGAREPLVATEAELSAGVSLKQIRHNPTPSVNHAADPG